MPRYYFDMIDGAFIRDDHGQPFADDQLALQHARKVANELCRNRGGTEELEIIVRDEQQNTILRITGTG